MTTLCLDFGNTRLKAALFIDNELKEIIVLNDDPVTDIKNILEHQKPQASILSSVINHDIAIENLLQSNIRFHKLSNTSKLPFTIPVGKPETVGADRLAIAAAAVHLFPAQNNLVIALGSCITYNFINKQHQLIGGSISPGTEMRLKALHHYTAKLPLVQAHWNVPLIGYDTATNIQSGVILGMAKEIDGIVEEYKKRFSNFNAVLTGGDIPFFEPHVKSKIFADPHLIFKGLYAISQYNNAS
ncbi:MAG TPA: type III pantothenate kinase [Chitinophagaceae bacterium]|nr:type III pantothenate kinase [Chitinophagaceae bacterium]